MSSQLGFIEPSTGIGEGIIRFHNELMLVIVFIVVFVTVMLLRIVMLYRRSGDVVLSDEVHGTLIEVIWTSVPGVVLMVLSVPSFTLLYAVEEVVSPSMTVKVIGNQWWWCLEYSDVGEEGLSYESYMILDDELEMGELRLLEVDNRLILPERTNIRIIVTSGDVLHSFAVPALGVKMDCCPGRLNELSIMVKRRGVYYGQCSELCGVNHAFMPICVEVVSVEEFINWLKSELSEK